MISIGAQFGGPEHAQTSIRRAIFTAMDAVRGARGERIAGAAPEVNTVFYVSGSCGLPIPAKTEAARFSRKQKLLLVAVPVPPEKINSTDALDFVIDALHKANAIAAEVFAKKNVGVFDLQKADEIVEKAKAEIATGRYEKQVADAIAKMNKQTQDAVAAIARANEGATAR
jgi:acetylornithine deacetylase/succinyl-diaminopimelate desuccinylase-like protein